MRRAGQPFRGETQRGQADTDDAEHGPRDDERGADAFTSIEQAGQREILLLKKHGVAARVEMHADVPPEPQRHEDRHEALGHGPDGLTPGFFDVRITRASASVSDASNLSRESPFERREG
jgi:hypothetical protein